MRLNISAWSIRHPIPAVMTFLILLVLGLYSFSILPITRFPNIDVPIVQVLVTQSGAAPAELETQVTKIVEDAVSGVSGVKHITSTITDGASSTIIQFHLSTPTDRALNDVKDAMATVRSQFPSTIDEPIIKRINIEGLPIVTYAAYAPGMSTADLSWYVDDTVTRALQGISGVGDVSRIGGVDREIRVKLDPDKLAALGITASAVNAQLRATNEDVSGGKAEIADREQAIRTLAGARSLADLAHLPISLSNGRKVKLSDLATITDGAAEATTFARYDGRPVVTFGITRASGFSDVEVAKAVATKVAALNKQHPAVKLQLIDGQVAYTYGNYQSAMETLIEGAVLSVIVVFLFLRNIRATILASVALPLSAIPTFWAMEALGFSLNLVTLLALTIVTGILVDDAIVEIENIVRHMRMGKSAYRAALEAADEIGLAVIAISLTIIGVFTPVSFMGGVAGQYFRQFGLTVAVAVGFSLMVARLITPLLAAYFMGPTPEHVATEGPILRAYTRAVRFSVRWRWLTVGVGLIFFVASIMSTGLLPKGFLPGEDTGRTLLAVELPPGSLLNDTARVTTLLSRKIKALPEVTGVLVYGGEVLGGVHELRRATLVINLIHKDKRKLTQKQIERKIDGIVATVPDIRAWFMKDNGMRDLQLTLEGDPGAPLAEVAGRLASEMHTIPTLANPVSTAELLRPELHVVPRANVAADLGVSTDAIADTVRVATIGDVGPKLANFTDGDRQIPIRVELPRTARGNLGLLKSLNVPTARGKPVPLSTVADISMGSGPSSITRYDRSRRVTVEADLNGTDALGGAIQQVMALPAAKNLPAGVRIVQSGDAEVMGEVFHSFAVAMGSGLMMVFAVLVLLFGNFLQPITILFSLPLSIGGAILALLITHKPISMPVVIGILMLMGIVTKNAIMLVDFAMEEMAAGVPRLEAIVDAGRKRARPIIMTTVAMVAGMIPPALALGDGGEFRSPMAIAVMGGLIVATMLSLIFVPAFFTIMDDVSRAIAWLFGRFVGQADEREPVVLALEAVPEQMRHAAE